MDEEFSSNFPGDSSMNVFQCKTEKDDGTDNDFVEFASKFWKEEPRDHDPLGTCGDEAEDPQDMDPYSTDTDFVTQEKTAEEFHVLVKTTNDTPLKCKFCSESFRTKYLLREHCNKHAGEKQYKCSFCPKSFFFNYDLMKHEVTHKEKKKTLKCKDCPKRFAFNCNLVSHQRTHNGERPFECNVCGKSFSEKYYVRKHEKIHRATSFNCKICKKDFAENSSLKAHEKTHKEAFKCSICKKYFLKNEYLRAHKKRHKREALKNNEDTPTKAFHCKTCEKYFSRKEYLKKHEKRHKKSNSKFNNHERTLNGQIHGKELKQELYDDPVDHTKEILFVEVKIECPIDEIENVS